MRLVLVRDIVTRVCCWSVGMRVRVHTVNAHAGRFLRRHRVLHVHNGIHITLRTSSTCTRGQGVVMR